MKKLYLPENYESKLTLRETEEAIKFVRDSFEKGISKALNLYRVSAPLFVFPSTGLNDQLNGTERRVSFDIKNIKEEVEIVQSLAKWKRHALHRYGFNVGEGLYTNMNAIRRDEDLDSMHSCYVDQWDWEKVISKDIRNEAYLKETVKALYNVIYNLSLDVESKYGISHNLPKEITFISTEELLKMYPNLDASQREKEAAKKYGAIFLMQIGDTLSNGYPHDGRAADYDDWKLNGDIILYYDVLDIAFEISSMGIRVDSESIKYQLHKKNEDYKLENAYVKGILSNTLPLTIGGGVGQSRLCMFMLKKAHIGEVQSSVWTDDDIKALESKNIHLL